MVQYFILSISLFIAPELEIHKHNVDTQRNLTGVIRLGLHFGEGGGDEGSGDDDESVGSGTGEMRICSARASGVPFFRKS